MLIIDSTFQFVIPLAVGVTQELFWFLPGISNPLHSFSEKASQSE
jgi:hypothetical protein